MPAITLQYGIYARQRIDIIISVLNQFIKVIEHYAKHWVKNRHLKS